jgi:predicted nucleic acid-binding protein
VKVFWDTNLFIYLWEKKSFAKEMSALTAFMEKGNHLVATSTLTLGEILVLPARSGREDLVIKYQEAMQQLTLLPYSQEAAVHFAHLRAANPSLRPPDAIQLACALTGHCDLFLTNDNRLADMTTPSTLQIQSLTDWMADQQ